MTIPNKQAKLFGIVELRIFKQLTDIAGQAPTYDTGIVIPGVKSLKYEGEFKEIEGRGDERILEVEYTDDKASVSFESLYFPLDSAVVINGGVVVDGANDSEYFEPGPDEVGSYFKIVALTKPRKEQLTIYKCRGRLDMKGLNGGEFNNASFKGSAVHTTGDIQGKPRRQSLKQSSVTMEIGGVKQIETATVVGKITTAGSATFIVTAIGMTGTPKTINVPVAMNDSAAVVAQKAREALTLDTAVSGMFAVSGYGPDVVLTKLLAATNDATMNISIDNGTCAGLIAEPTSVSTVKGQA